MLVITLLFLTAPLMAMAQDIDDEYDDEYMYEHIIIEANDSEFSDTNQLNRTSLFGIRRNVCRACKNFDYSTGMSCHCEPPCKKCINFDYSDGKTCFCSSPCMACSGAKQTSGDNCQCEPPACRKCIDFDYSSGKTCICEAPQCKFCMSFDYASGRICLCQSRKTTSVRPPTVPPPTVPPPTVPPPTVPPPTVPPPTVPPPTVPPPTVPPPTVPPGCPEVTPVPTTPEVCIEVTTTPGPTIPPGPTTVPPGGTPTPPPFICPTKHGRFPAPNSCKYYYDCTLGHVKVKKCRKNKYFDPVKLKCQRDPSVCTVDMRNTECVFVGHFPDFESCTDYYACLPGPHGTLIRMKKTCGPNQYFDIFEDDCVEGECNDEDDDE